MATSRKFTQEMHALVVARLNERAGGVAVCPICRIPSSSWQFHAYVASPIDPEFSGGYDFTKSALPSVVAVCKNCTHTMFFNAVMLGLVGP